MSVAVATRLLNIRPGQFQKFDPMDAVKRERLKAKIAAEGVRTPIVVTTDGEIVDGHTRWAIAQELDIHTADIPVEVRAYTSTEEAAEDAITLNTWRRSGFSVAEADELVRDLRERGELLRASDLLGITTKEQVDHTIAVLREAGMSNRAVAEATGVSRETVRRDSSGGTNVPPEESVIGKDGKRYRTRDQIADHRRALPELERQGLRDAEIADALGVSVQTVHGDRYALKQAAKAAAEGAAVASHERIAELAGRGLTGTQIATELGMSVGGVKNSAKRHNIDIHADRLMAKTRKPQATKAVGNVVTNLADLVYTFGFIEVPLVDATRPQIEDWVCSLNASAKAIRTLIQQLNQLEGADTNE